MNSLGVVIPTKNSRTQLPLHLTSANQWLDIVDEIVVVDSQSKDGTVDYLKEHLRHPKLRFLSHPPGLYESWNYGIQELNTDYVYLSTTGDTITGSGLQHLKHVALQFKADVVMSKPTFQYEDGLPAPEPAWPLDEILARRKATAPIRLRPLEMIVYAAAYPGGGLLGSSASNLYRTRCLQQHPFPTEYGAAGDGVWAVQQAHRFVWSVTPERFSTFLLHPKNHAPGDKPLRLDLVLHETLALAVREGELAETQLQPAGIPELLEISASWLRAKLAFDKDRQKAWPWSLNPAAWIRRHKRNRRHRELMEAQTRSLNSLLEPTTFGND